MTRVWAAVRPLALLTLGFVLGFVGNFLGAVWFGHGGTWQQLRQALRRWLEWPGYSPDKQARIRADERRRRGLGEPDHFDVLDEKPQFAKGGLIQSNCDSEHPPAWLASGGCSPLFWRHQPVPGGITHLARRGEPCGYCGAEEPR